MLQIICYFKNSCLVFKLANKTPLLLNYTYAINYLCVYLIFLCLLTTIVLSFLLYSFPHAPLFSARQIFFNHHWGGQSPTLGGRCMIGRRNPNLELFRQRVKGGSTAERDCIGNLIRALCNKIFHTFPLRVHSPIFVLKSYII